MFYLTRAWSQKGVKLAQKMQVAILWEYRYKRLKLRRLLGQLGVFLTLDNYTTDWSTLPRQTGLQ